MRRHLDPYAPNTIAGYIAGVADTLSWRRLLFLLVICFVAGLSYIFKPGSATLGAQLAVAVLYLASLAALVPLHLFTDRRVTLTSGILCVALGGVLTFTYTDALSSIVFTLLALVLLFRLPWSRSLPALALVGGLFALLLLAHSISQQLSGASANPFGDFLRALIVFTLVTVTAVGARWRAQVLRRLRDTEAQLRSEVARTAELAATRERARIARDMHDVLAHSLTVLSIQTQAARQVVTQDPQRAAAMLDEIGVMLRESIRESRRLVGVLRDTAHTTAGRSSLGENLAEIADRFMQRTGVRVTLAETGEPHPLADEAQSALRLTAQEALTNAYRHGAARAVSAELAWEPRAVTLAIRDDGAAAPAAPQEPGGGNGLRGMRERAAALGGAVSSGPLTDGGFRVAMSLPLFLTSPTDTP